MIDWSSKFARRVRRRLKKEAIIWFTTVGTDLTPQPRPVWFLWDDDSFLIFSQPAAHKVRHVRAHTTVALNLNSDEGGDDVAVIIGTAAIDSGAPPAYKTPAYLRKYRKAIANLRMSPEEFSKEYSVAIRVIPSALRGF